MTREELKQEAEEWLCNNLHSASEEDFIKAMVDIAEPREKRIEELEHQLTHRNCLDCSNHSSNLRIRNLELEKENAELKSEKGCESCTKFDEVQLIKAKELLKQWVQTSRASGCDNTNIVTDTEQFLKDSEVEK